MEVIYKKSIFDKLADEIKKASDLEVEIDVIKLNYEEVRELYSKRDLHMWVMPEEFLMVSPFAAQRMSFEEFVACLNKGIYVYFGTRLCASV